MGGTPAVPGRRRLDRPSQSVAFRRGGAGMTERFCLYLVKPSHYDDDGYVIQWFRSAIPSNSLAVMHGLAEDCRIREVLGPEVAFDIVALDETNTRVRPEIIAADIARAGRGLVCLVGV